MAGNRVEELEAKVRELEATISGLTDELVETKERVHALEDHVDLRLDDVVEGQPSRMEAREAGVGELQRGDAEESGSAEVVDADGGTEDEAAEAADGANSEEGETEGESDADDIIVA